MYYISCGPCFFLSVMKGGSAVQHLVSTSVRPRNSVGENRTAPSASRLYSGFADAIDVAWYIHFAYLTGIFCSRTLFGAAAAASWSQWAGQTVPGYHQHVKVAPHYILPTTRNHPDRKVEARAWAPSSALPQALSTCNPSNPNVPTNFFFFLNIDDRPPIFKSAWYNIAFA